MKKKAKKTDEEMNKAMESYYNSLGHYHTECIIKEQDAKMDEINQIEIPSSMNEWFEKFSKKYRRKEKLKMYTKKIGSLIAKLFISYFKG
ncbi:MAG: hypothetical protein MJA82_09395 [Clostridia bacterium]|nr:hypothetical protein [Clostridia bacterium]